ncbi:MAG TPA: hypothetical protein VJG90_06575 [Candidatus Nanoarchaeia archaeon]|nr:hypothetical protein [Candidatus Nanoarchaeia archaeon]
MDTLDPKVGYVWNLRDRIIQSELHRVLRLDRAMEDLRTQEVGVKRSQASWEEPEQCYVECVNLAGTGGHLDLSIYSDGQLPKGVPIKVVLRWGYGLPFVAFEEDLHGELIAPVLGKAPNGYGMAADALRELLPRFHGLSESVAGEEAEGIFSSALSGEGKFGLRKDGSSSIGHAFLTLPKSSLTIGYARDKAMLMYYTQAMSAAQRTLTSLLNNE